MEQYYKKIESITYVILILAIIAGLWSAIEQIIVFFQTLRHYMGTSKIVASVNFLQNIIRSITYFGVIIIANLIILSKQKSKLTVLLFLTASLILLVIQATGGLGSIVQNIFLFFSDILNAKQVLRTSGHFGVSLLMLILTIYQYTELVKTFKEETA